MQNGDILVLADPGLPGRMTVEMEREHLVVWSAVGVSDHTLYVLIPVRFGFADDSHENG